MRILITTGYQNVIGGLEKYVHVTIPGLLARGHAAALLHGNPYQAHVDAIVEPGGRVPTWCVSELGMKAALDSVSRWKPDVVYFHGLDVAESITMERALIEAYPVVFYAHNYDRTCATGRKVYSSPEPQCCTRTLGPMCRVLHYPRRCGGLNPATMLQDYRRHTDLNVLLPRHRAVLVASTHMYAEFRRHGVDARQLHLVPLPVTDSNSETLQPRQVNGNILFVGRLTDVKGVDYLLGAVPQAADLLQRPLTVTIAGDGPERSRLERLANSLRVSVNFTGWVSTQTKLELMSTAGLLAVPSVWPEPFALVGVEAGSVGLPAVGYAVGGIPDWLIPGETGELASANPPRATALAEAIHRALASAEHYKTLSTGAWAHSKKYTLERHLAALEPILAAAAAEQSGSRFETQPCALRV